MSGDILTVKTVKRVRSVRGSALVHITLKTNPNIYDPFVHFLKSIIEKNPNIFEKW